MVRSARTTSLVRRILLIRRTIWLPFGHRLFGGGISYERFLARHLAHSPRDADTIRLVTALIARNAQKRVDPQAIVDAAGELGRQVSLSDVHPNYLVALAEAGVWLDRRELAAEAIGSAAASVSEGTIRRLSALFAWRFDPREFESETLLSPLLPDNAIFEFVDHYARARAADELDRLDIAYPHYVRALLGLPYDSKPYHHARDRCNAYRASRLTS